jgi:hypothetical protein
MQAEEISEKYPFIDSYEYNFSVIDKKIGTELDLELESRKFDDDFGADIIDIDNSTYFESEKKLRANKKEEW